MSQENQVEDDRNRDFNVKKCKKKRVVDYKEGVAVREGKQVD